MQKRKHGLKRVKTNRKGLNMCIQINIHKPYFDETWAWLKVSLIVLWRIWHFDYVPESILIHIILDLSFQPLPYVFVLQIRRLGGRWGDPSFVDSSCRIANMRNFCIKQCKRKSCNFHPGPGPGPGPGYRPRICLNMKFRYLLCFLNII